MTKPVGKPEPIVDDQEEVEDIVVPDDADKPQDNQDIDLDEEDANDVEFKKLDNKAFAALRKEATEAKREREELRKKVDAYEKKQTAASPTPKPAPQELQGQREFIGGIAVPQTKEEWDILARKDWQSAVDLRSIISARKVRDEHVKQETSTRQLNESKERVLQKHPELADANSDKGQIFLKILDKNPDYLTMSKGPILAMRDMEDEMEALGYTKEQIFETKKAAAQTEITRVNRGALTAGGRMPERSARTVQLSKDDLEFCKTQGLDPKDYAREKLEIENNKRGAQL